MGLGPITIQPDGAGAPTKARSLAWDNSPVTTVRYARFRYNASVTLAALVAALGAIPLAAAGFYNRTHSAPWWAYVLLLVLLLPIGVAVWGWRAGTDAGQDGLRVRANGLAWTPVAWSEIVGIVPQGRRVYAILTDDRAVPLPAVSPSDIERLVAASGAQLTPEPGPAETPAESEPVAG